jgi:hypothetical protein
MWLPNIFYFEEVPQIFKFVVRVGHVPECFSRDLTKQGYLVKRRRSLSRPHCTADDVTT